MKQSLFHLLFLIQFVQLTVSPLSSKGLCLCFAQKEKKLRNHHKSLRINKGNLKLEIGKSNELLSLPVRSRWRRNEY